MTLHPASWLLTWLFMALALQWLPLPLLLAVAAPILVLALWQARPRFLLMLRRTRFLLLSILILFAAATPGEPLPGWAGTLGLSLQGSTLALAHSLRLSLLLALLALLLEHLSLAELVGGLYVLLAPLGSHPQRSRMALRLLLVLDYVEQEQQKQRTTDGAARRRWRDWLDPRPADIIHPTDPIPLPLTPLHAVDRWLMAGALLTTLLLWLIYGTQVSA